MSDLNIKDYPKSKHALIRAILIAGGPKEFSKYLKVTPQVVNSWLHTLKEGVPVRRCPDIEKMTNGEVTCKQLRPDFFVTDEKIVDLSTEEKVEKCMLLMKNIYKEIKDSKMEEINKERKKGVK